MLLTNHNVMLGKFETQNSISDEMLSTSNPQSLAIDLKSKRVHE